MAVIHLEFYSASVMRTVHAQVLLPQGEAARRYVFSLWCAFCIREGVALLIAQVKETEALLIAQLEKLRSKKQVGACQGPPGRPLPLHFSLIGGY